MRHRVAHRKLGRVTDHRIALLRNQATALIRYEHLTTTVPKAKELRPFVERLITVAKRGLAGGDKNGHTLNARRLVMQDLQDRNSPSFDTIAPRFCARPGYTRLREWAGRGDSAEVAQVELVGAEFDQSKANCPRKNRSRRPGESAAARCRTVAAAGRQRAGAVGKATNPRRYPRATTPRKAGGS
jgi:large subunit ribosomal protein L17